MGLARFRELARDRAVISRLRLSDLFPNSGHSLEPPQRQPVCVAHRDGGHRRGGSKRCRQGYACGTQTCSTHSSSTWRGLPN